MSGCMGRAFQGWEQQSIRTDDGEECRAVAPVIVSASRSTDIPAFYGSWFMNRLRAGYAARVNPFNGQTHYVSFLRTRVVVFWTKNPGPFLARLPELDAMGLNYYFQFTLNDYDDEGFEPNVPPLTERISIVNRLAGSIGRERVVWRFDPLLLSDRTDVDRLLEKVRSVGDRVCEHVGRLVISFADIAGYRKVQSNLARTGGGFREFAVDEMREFAERLMPLAERWGLPVATCAEAADLSEYGIGHNRCIDDELLIRLFPGDEPLMSFLGVGAGEQGELFGPQPVHNPRLKDKGQRKECGCIVSRDIGMYDTCPHLCVYCYANTSEAVVRRNCRCHDPGLDCIVA